MLQISRNTLDVWLKREQETGDFQAIITKPGRPRKILNEEKFKEFVRENNDKTQEKMAELLGSNLTQQNISYACRKLGITRKKLTAIKKEMKKKELNF